MAKIKLVEGVVVAAQSFIGELVFFYFSGEGIEMFKLLYLNDSKRLS